MMSPFFAVIREDATMGKMLNFDQFMQEHEKRTIDVQVFGETYTVPMEIPAIVPVMMARAEESMDPAQSTRMVMRAADAMFGSEAVNRMCQKGMSAKNLAELVQRLFTEITGSDEDDEAQELDDESGKVQTKGNNAKK